MLSTHLSFPQIAKEFFLSQHTIKSEAESIYRKLGVNTRDQAVSRARELGLLEGYDRSPPIRGMAATGDSMWTGA
jgi:LuxR family maltose regulon positive regulatory protein